MTVPLLASKIFRTPLIGLDPGLRRDDGRPAERQTSAVPLPHARSAAFIGNYLCCFWRPKGVYALIADDQIKSLEIVRMLCSHLPVPPCEIETEIGIAVAMMQVMMGGCRDPAERASGPTRGKQLDTGMPHGVANDHMDQENRNR